MTISKAPRKRGKAAAASPADPGPAPAAAAAPASALAAASADLVKWFRGAARFLPWRTDQHGWGLSVVEEAVPGGLGGGGLGAPAAGAHRRDPYRTWIAEIMLQQTQVATVIEYYRRWVERFPDVRTLAAAREEDVLARWAGLGYYSRARNILATAREVVAAHGGEFPRDREALLRLKGIGEYTAGAIASLAFGLPEPILDGNLARVFSRLYGLDFLPGDARGKAAYWDLARAWVASGEPALVNEGLMELGALVCTPRNPACPACPLAAHCRARAEGRQEELPPPKPRKAVEEIQGYAALVRGPGGLLLHRPPRGELLSGLLNLPLFPLEGVPTLAALRKAWAARLPGLPVPAFRPRPATVTHGVTHHLFRLRVVEGVLGPEAGGLPWPVGWEWMVEDRVEDALVSAFPRKILAAARKGKE